MENDTSYITSNEQLLRLIEATQGFNFTCEQLKELTQNPNSPFFIVYGCINSLSYGISYSYNDKANHQVPEPELVQVSLLTSDNDVIKITSKTDVNGSEFRVVTNLNAYERIIKNAADFEHEIYGIIEGCELMFLTLIPFKCRQEDRGIAVARQVIDVPTTPPRPRRRTR